MQHTLKQQYFHINENDEKMQNIVYAARNDSKEMLKLLISKGANINEKDIIYLIIIILFLIK